MAASQQLFVGGLCREAAGLDLAAHAARDGALARPVEDPLAAGERAAAGAAVAGVAGLDPVRIACVPGHLSSSLWLLSAPAASCRGALAWRCACDGRSAAMPSFCQTASLVRLNCSSRSALPHGPPSS